VELEHLVRTYGEADAGDILSEPYAASQFDATLIAALLLEAVGPTADLATLRGGFRAVTRGGHAYGLGEMREMLAAIRRGEQVDYVGASGNVEIDDDGDVEADLVTWEIKEGRVLETGRVPVD
jgi:branched-chain amino acid transport system substrate-binding protein